jgi:DNA-binding IclR family transcriptional regulator
VNTPPTPHDGAAKNSTVDRALQVLEAFLVDEETLALADLTRVLPLDASVIHRILATLVRRQFLKQDPATKRYGVGLRTWEIGQRYLASSPLAELAQEAVDQVVRRHPYTTGYVATLDGDQMVILATVRGPGPVNIMIDPGARMPAALTATGRAMLAHLPADRLQRLRARLAAQREGRPGSRQPADLTADLRQIRERGYVVNRGEYFPGIGTVALSIRGADGGPMLAISVDFPIAIETEQLFEDLPGQLREAINVLGRVVPASSL